jgi:uncharacterized protein (TIGR02996 family)
MDEEAAILAAIVAHPDEDTPRLAYADWLDDHAAALPDPPAARVRAEFIRVQCEIKKLDDLPSAELQGYADLYRRQDALLTRHRRDLLGSLADDLGPHDAVFDRGFVTELRLDADRFLRHADGIEAFRPLPDVTVFGAARSVVPLLASGRVGLIGRLEMQSERWAYSVPLTWAEVEPLATTGPFTRLRELDCSNGLMGDEPFEFLVRSPNFPALTHLDVSNNEISDAAVLSLVNAPLWPRLKYLVLGANPISDEGAFALADAPPTAIEYLNLKATALGRAGQQRLLRRKGWKVDLF